MADPPDDFDWGRMHEEAVEEEEARARLPKPGAKLLKIGGTLLGIAMSCGIVVRATLRIFFPERLGAGLDAIALAILIPIWVTGGVGLLLLAVGGILRLRGQRRSPQGSGRGFP